MSNPELRRLYDELAFVKSFGKEHNIDVAELVRDIRSRIHKLCNTRDNLSIPVTEGWRCHYYDWDGGTEYSILPDNGESEEAFEEWAKEQFELPPICSPYDCTGKAFTLYIHVKRTPAGFVVVHHWRIDV